LLDRILAIFYIFNRKIIFLKLLIASITMVLYCAATEKKACAGVGEVSNYAPFSAISKKLQDKKRLYSETSKFGSNFPRYSSINLPGIQNLLSNALISGTKLSSKANARTEETQNTFNASDQNW
jgi:hypothetical protein